MKYHKYKSLMEHAVFVARAFKLRLRWYRDRGLELTPTSPTFLWQQRRHMISVTTRMMAVNFMTDDDTPQLKEWRKGSMQANMVTRLGLIVLTQQQSATVTNIANVCEEFASRESVRKVLNQGVSLGLLEKVDGDRYAISDILANELFNRAIMRLRHPDVVEFSKLCVTMANLESMMLEPEFDPREEHPLSTGITMANALKDGIYEEITEAVEENEKVADFHRFSKSFDPLKK